MSMSDEARRPAMDERHDQRARTIDTSRLVTFVSNHAFSTAFQLPGQEASRYVDLICINMYEDLAARLDRVHQRRPDKPVLVSEYGVRGDALTPADRDAFFRKAYEIFRARPYVVGASVWTYNDYRSRWPVGTDKQGRRQWGVVTYDRQPKSSYAVLAAESLLALIRDAGAVNRGVSRCNHGHHRQPRHFPAYTLRGYTAHVRLLDAAGSVLAAHSVVLPDAWGTWSGAYGAGPRAGKRSTGQGKSRGGPPNRLRDNLGGGGRP